MMEILVQKSGELALEKLNKARSKVLEAEAIGLFTTRFSNARIYAGSRWFDQESSKTFENDLLVVIDRFAIVVECKAGTVNQSARRGGELKVVETLRKLVVEPAEQALRFVRFLSKNPGVHTFTTLNGGSNVVNNQEVDCYVPVTLSQEDLGSVSGNLRMSIDAGLIPSNAETGVPSISIHDLEIIFTVLDNEIEVLHYLTRRAELEQQISYLGDEGDLLAFYLDTAFNLVRRRPPAKCPSTF
jgi:hypothetical protein